MTIRGLQACMTGRIEENESRNQLITSAFFNKLESRIKTNIAYKNDPLLFRAIFSE